ncbi:MULTISPECIES: tyrosine recombinase XerC [unclassified Nocardia]|uniref:site-specific integrase n=1 Tax=unclassified Nocardia TaxID=2637762 RepID=UPI001CE43682|nr:MULTISPECIES: tyrosine-type recombinase/integrase [unclassified Nocardia]
MTGTEIEAAKLLLARLGVRPEDLLASAASNATVPTFDEYIPRLESAVPAGTLRAYGPYWRRIRESWHDRPIDEPTATEIRQLIEHTKRSAVIRRNACGGRSAAEHMVAALRCLYRHAQHDGYIARAAHPASEIAKPRRLASSRHALPDHLLADINHVAATTGNDPDLDALIVRLHIETACRRGGALALRPDDLDTEQCLIRLREKGGTVRWQPVTPTLMGALVKHCERGAEPGEQLLRYRNGQPITGRRYDYLWNRIGRHLPWVATQQVTAHWLRHTTLTWVERHCGYAVARAFAGHAEPSGNAGATLTYIRASMFEVAYALSAMTGEAHPLTTT